MLSTRVTYMLDNVYKKLYMRVYNINIDSITEDTDNFKIARSFQYHVERM